MIINFLLKVLKLPLAHRLAYVRCSSLCFDYVASDIEAVSQALLLPWPQRSRVKSEDVHRKAVLISLV